MASGMPTCLRVIERSGKAFEHLGSRQSDVARGGLTREGARQGACDHHQTRRVEHLGLVDRPAIVIQRSAQTRGICRRKEAAAAITRKLDAGIFDLPSDGSKTSRLHLVAPGVR